MRLATKFNLLIAALLAMMSVGIAGFEVHRRIAEDRAALHRHGVELAGMVARHAQFAIYTESAPELAQIVEGLSIASDLAYFRLMDREGAILAERITREGIEIPDVDRPLADSSATPVVTEARSAEGQSGTLDFLAPVTGGTDDDPESLLLDAPGASSSSRVIGYVQVGLSDERMRRRIARFLGSTSVFTCLLGAGGVLLTILITRRFLHPIHALANATRDVAAGNLDQNVPEDASAEIGELAGDFNRMLTQLRIASAEVEMHRQGLEEKVAQRTAELERSTEEARELARRAEEASRAKSQFLANMSHEIRTPMNGVMGMTELLLGSELNQTQRKFAKTVWHSAESLLGVINDVLDFSKAEAGKLALEIDDFDIRESVGDICDLLAESAHAKGLELTQLVADEAPAIVRADGLRLRQVLTNLVSNAVKFTEEGEVHINVRSEPPREGPTEGATADRAAHCRLLFTVTDTGTGVAEDARERVFESFTQGDGSLARRFGGTGLGLSICRQLIELMGGEIGYRPAHPRGSYFWFAVPVEVVEASTRPEEDRGGALAGLRVLVVDDNSTNRRILCHHLGSWGCRVDLAVDGPSGLTELQRAGEHGVGFDLAILDMMMPGMTGLELARSIRADPRQRSLRLVMLTSVAVSISAEEAAEIALSAQLTKPVRRAELQRALACTVGAARNRAEPLSANASPPETAGPGFAARVLVAEDNPVNQEVATAILEDLGCSVKLVANGREAVEAVGRECFDLVFMDCQMPEMDGFEATAQIRAAETAAAGSPGPSAPQPGRCVIVALTAHAFERHRELCLEAGMDDCVSKPFSRDRMAEVLERWLPADTAPSAADGSRRPQQAQPAGLPSPSPAESEPTGGPLAQLEELGARSGSQLLEGVIATWLWSSEELAQALHRAFEADDAEAVSRAAHSLKSSSAQVEQGELAALCKELEHLARCGSLAGAAELVQRLDAELDAARERLSARHLEQAPPAAASTARRERVLVIDDDPVFRDVVGEAMAGIGLAVVEAVDGATGLAAAGLEAPDLVLLDVEMPDMDGYQVCQELRRNLPLGDIPVVFSTGHADFDSIQRAFDAGATDFITKPLNPDVLQHRVRFFLRAGRAFADLRSVLSRLDESSRRLASAQRLAGIGNWEWEAATDHLLCSTGMEMILGPGEEERRLPVSDLLALISREDRERVERALLVARNEGRPSRLDHRIVACDGSELIVDHQIEALGDGPALPHSVRGTIQDITQRKSAEERIRRLAYYDSLTSLPNRRLMIKHLQRALERAGAEQRMLGLLFLDIDCFKRINDTLGHAAGDQLIAGLGERLLAAVRSKDYLGRSKASDLPATVSRLGGDEFTLVLSDIREPQDGARVARRILDLLEQPFTLNGQEVVVSASIGIAIHPGDGSEVETLLRHADTAMYHAKLEGRGSYRFYNQSMNANAARHLSIENALRESLACEDFLLHFQPVIDARSGQTRGLEALLRWHHEELGAVAPDELIPIAEDSGLIVPLGEWVLRAACRQLRAWEDQGFPPVRVAVNVSTHQIRRPGLVETLKHALEESRVAPESLELEITETVFLEKQEQVLEVLHGLKRLGVRLAIDDFGTGYSSMAYLRRFPLDILKIDRTFVSGLPDQEDARVIVSAIVAMAHRLGLEVVAEGVETQEQAEFLRSELCDTFQGFLFARPVEADQVTRFFPGSSEA